MEFCPFCGKPLGALGRYCHKCQRYTDEGEAEEPKVVGSPPESRCESEPLSLWLPWDTLASDNKRKGLNRESYRQYKAARDAASVCLMGQVRDRPWWREGEVDLTLTFSLPDRRRRDPNNLTKMICDALSGIAYTDDSQIVRMNWSLEVCDQTSPGVSIIVALAKESEE